MVVQNLMQDAFARAAIAVGSPLSTNADSFIYVPGELPVSISRDVNSP